MITDVPPPDSLSQRLSLTPGPGSPRRRRARPGPGILVTVLSASGNYMIGPSDLGRDRRRRRGGLRAAPWLPAAEAQGAGRGLRVTV